MDPSKTIKKFRDILIRVIDIIFNDDDDVLIKKLDENNLFSFQEIIDICNEVASKFLQEDSLVEIEIAEMERLYIFGDTHGQFLDLREMFEKIGYPVNKEKDKYLFLGYVKNRDCFFFNLLI
jgi:hypothetical protein